MKTAFHDRVVPMLHGPGPPTRLVEVGAFLRAEVEPTFHEEVRRELQLLVAPGLPAMLALLGLAIFCVLGAVAADVPGTVLGAAFRDGAPLVAVASVLPLVAMACAYLLGLSWLTRWTLLQRRTWLALPFGLVALSSGALAVAVAGLLFPPWALLPGFYLVRAIFLILWTSTRSLLRRDYCLARLASREPSYDIGATRRLVDGLLGTGDGRGLVGVAIITEVWFVRAVTRPFVRPSRG